MTHVDTDPVGRAKGAARAVRARMLGPPRGQNRAARRINLSAAAGDFAHRTSLVVELNTGDLQATRRGACIPVSISRPEMSSAPRGPRCAPIALRCLLARGFCCARLPSPFQLGHPLLDAAHPLDGLNGGYQIH